MAEITWFPWSCSGLLPTSSPQLKVDFLISYKDTKFNKAISVLTHPYAGIAVLISKKFTLLEPTTLLQGMLLNFKIRWYKKNCNANDPQLEAPEMQDLVDCPSSRRHAQSQNHYYYMIIKLKYEFLFQNHPT